MRRRVLIIGTLALVVAIPTLVFALTEPEPIWARNVSEVIRGPRATRVRVQGALVRGSLCRVPGKCEYRFRLSDLPWRAGSGASRERELEVRYGGCVIPDTFRDIPGFDVEITTQGELCDGCSYFEATEIMAKCPSKYEMIRDGGMHPFAAPVPFCRLGQAP